jgi:hypothetical protein
MTETRTPYTTHAPQPQRLTVTLTLDIADAAIAAYLTDLVQANPPVTRQGFDPQNLDRAMLDAFLDAAGAKYPEEYEDEQDYAADAFAERYYAQAWLSGFGLTAVVAEA